MSEDGKKNVEVVEMKEKDQGEEEMPKDWVMGFHQKIKTRKMTMNYFAVALIAVQT